MSLGLDLKPFKYNRTECKDGITHIINTDKSYEAIKVEIFGNYFDYKSEQDLINQIQEDLRGLDKRLEEIKNNNKNKIKGECNEK